jgi:hypothetical protein
MAAAGAATHGAAAAISAAAKILEDTFMQTLHLNWKNTATFIAAAL